MKIIFMGTGAADGIPRIRCKCAHCQEARNIAIKLEKGKIPWEYVRIKKRILRKRTSVLIESKDTKILLDVPPEIHRFLNEYSIDDISAIFLSHKHFDHISGLREFEFWDGTIDFYAGSDVIPIAKGFVKSGEDQNNNDFHFYELRPRRLISLKNFEVIPFRVKHKVPTFGFLFEEDDKKLMHFSDSTSEFSDWHIKKMEKANVVVFHTTTFDKVSSDHISVKDVLDLISYCEIKKIVLSHINHENLPYEKLVKKLSSYSNIVVAYDGMEIVI